MRRRRGHSILEATIAITLVAGAIWIIGNLISVASIQVRKVECQSPAHARVSLGTAVATICTDGAMEVSGSDNFELIKVQGRSPDENPKLYVEVKL